MKLTTRKRYGVRAMIGGGDERRLRQQQRMDMDDYPGNFKKVLAIMAVGINQPNIIQKGAKD